MTFPQIKVGAALAALPTRITLSQGLAAAFGIGWAATAFNTYADLRFEGPFGIGLGFEGWKPQAERMEDERDEAEAEVKKLKDAQAEAQRKLAEAIKQREQAERERKEKADELDRATRAEWRDATERYVNDHLVRRPRAAASESGGAAPTEESATSYCPNGLGEMPELVGDAVLVSRDDFDILVDNTRRLYVAHKWALDQIDNGELASE